MISVIVALLIVGAALYLLSMFPVDATVMQVIRVLVIAVPVLLVIWSLVRQELA